MASKAQKRLNKLMNVKNRLAREAERELHADGGPIRHSTLYSVQRSAFDAARCEVETGVRQTVSPRASELDTLRRMLGM